MKLQALILLILPLLTQSFVSAETATRKQTYAEVLVELNRLATTYPDQVKSVTVGESDSGQKIMGLQIGKGATHNLVVATHHGNEYGSTEVAMGFARAIAEKPIAAQTVYVIPVLNITGYNTRTRTEMSQANKKVYDPNRNYPSPCGTEGPFTLKDTTALAKFIVEKNIITSATLHTFSPAVTYPWGFSSPDLTTGYESIFKGLVSEATRESHYDTGNTADLIYPANGTFEDYAFLQHGIWSLLFELGSSHSPSELQTAEMVRVNVPGIRRMLESAPTARAEKHAFNGKCDNSKTMQARDLHDE